MKTTMITLKVDKTLKQNAQVIAADLGFSLSSLINGYLRHLVRTKEVNFTLHEEIPTQYMIDSLKEAEENIKNGDLVSFTNAHDAINYLNSYVNDAEKNPQD